MTTLQMIGWKPGVQTVSLVQLIRDASTGSLTAAKQLVDDLLNGSPVEIQFSTPEQAQDFRERAESLGVIIHPGAV
jgi:hypothetical protein